MPRTSRNIQDTALLQAALQGLELQRQRIEEQINAVKARLGSPGAAKTGRGGRRPLSAAARKRIAAAQKRRWAEYRKQQQQQQS
jgi:hypothetical protein